jgi:hypothetical protein
LRHSETGRTLFTASPPMQEHPVYLAAAPVNAPGPFIGTIRNTGSGAKVCFFRKDMTPGKAVFIDPWGRVADHQYPRMDMMGEYIAWTTPGGVALKHVNEPASRTPSYLRPRGFGQVYFCDWTDQGTLLCNGTENGQDYVLFVMDKDGKVVRRMETPVRPLKGVIASWRKYGHR